MPAEDGKGAAAGAGAAGADVPAPGVAAEAPGGGEAPSRVAAEIVPLLRKLRSRIRAYAALWASAGAITLLVAVPAFREKCYVAGASIAVFAVSVMFFALVRAAEAKSVSAIIETDRSEARRKAFLAVNLAVFLAALAVFVVSAVWAPAALNPWIALPSSLFVLAVSLSPAWEWFFIRRPIRAHRETLEDFDRYLRLICKTRKARDNSLVALDALALLDTLRAKGVLPAATYALVQKDLLGF